MKPLTANAADPVQVSEARKKEKFNREDELNDIRIVLSTPAGRRYIWRLLGKCGVHRSIWSRDASIHYNSGQQDLGHFIEAEIVEANEDLLFQMMVENRRGNTNG